MSTEMTEWLRAQLDTDERTANEALEALHPMLRSSTWQARVLRQAQAHRAILDAYEGAVAEVQYDPHDETRSADESTLQWVVGTLASIYSDRAGYRPEWRP